MYIFAVILGVPHCQRRFSHPYEPMTMGGPLPASERVVCWDHHIGMVLALTAFGISSRYVTEYPDHIQVQVGHLCDDDQVPVCFVL
jgi:hypothetical protein